MKKIITLIPLFSALSCSSVVFAGGMGGSQCCSGFMSLEGGYTWTSISGYEFTLDGLGNTFSSVVSKQGYSARIGGGVINMIDDDFGVTGEVGWGYYGKTTLNSPEAGIILPVSTSLSMSHTLSGFDALIGVAFMQPYYTLSFKAGALIQNMQTKTAAFIAPIAFPVFDSLNIKTNQTAVLPEIKVGAAYNFNENWALTAAFMFALGAKNKTTGEFDVNTFRGSLNVNNQNPSMGTGLLGIQYTA